MNVNLHLQHKTHWREIPITSRNKVLDKSVDASCGYRLLDVNATKIIFYTSIHIICCSFVGEHDFWMPSFQCGLNASAEMETPFKYTFRLWSLLSWM